MIIDDLKSRKRDLGYTNEYIAELSGVPIGTVQKIFSGETKAPRYDTIQKLLKVLGPKTQSGQPYEAGSMAGGFFVNESSALYEYNSYGYPSGRIRGQVGRIGLKPPKKRLGIADGKFKMPPDDLLFDDEICDMFEDI